MLISFLFQGGSGEDAMKPTAGPSSCEMSDFGCCPDGQTAAASADGAGCDQPCQRTEFGCCEDSKWPLKKNQLGKTTTCSASTAIL